MKKDTIVGVVYTEGIGVITKCTVNDRFPLPLPSRKHILFYSLFYLITLEDRRGTSDEFATIPFHLVLFSAALVELVKSIPVHPLILSSHLFFCLPLILFPFKVPCRIVFARPEDLETWPNHLSFRFLTVSGVRHILQWLLGSFCEPPDW